MSPGFRANPGGSQEQPQPCRLATWSPSGWTLPVSRWQALGGPLPAGRPPTPRPLRQSLWRPHLVPIRPPTLCPHACASEDTHHVTACPPKGRICEPFSSLCLSASSGNVHSGHFCIRIKESNLQVPRNGVKPARAPGHTWGPSLVLGHPRAPPVLAEPFGETSLHACGWGEELGGGVWWRHPWSPHSTSGSLRASPPSLQLLGRVGAYLLRTGCAPFRTPCFCLCLQRPRPCS